MGMYVICPFNDINENKHFLIYFIYHHNKTIHCYNITYIIHIQNIS